LRLASAIFVMPPSAQIATEPPPRRSIPAF